jgi:hypothetical protein
MMRTRNPNAEKEDLAPKEARRNAVSKPAEDFALTSLKGGRRAAGETRDHRNEFRRFDRFRHMHLKAA